LSYLLAFFSAVLLLLSGCSASPEDVRESRFIMGTLVQFTISGADEDVALEAIHAAADEMRRIENTFTIYGEQANSIKVFNASVPGESVALPEEVESLLLTSLEVAKLSGGAFTPAIGELSLLWGFSLPEPRVSPPSAEDIATARRGVDIKLLERTEAGWRRLSGQTRLDFGAIAKGYAIDRGITVLRKHGISHAILDAGGDLRAIGNHAGQPWRIGLRHPRKAGGTLGWFEVEGDISIVTSGDYERFFIHQNRRYQHILDPQTGWPAEQSRSATVITSGNTTLADAWSTALFVRGAKALAVIESHGMQALQVDAAGNIHTTGLSLVTFHPTVEN